ncbi:hypothetical protein V6Z72_12815 [Cereibacter sphaeroides]|uniref:hypothetical protein n=1 Tax=Cereibacter sphaeroides TaxID=1063 RepID=UPI00399099B9
MPAAGGALAAARQPAIWNRPLLEPRILRLHAENAAFLADRIAMARDGPNERALDLFDLEARLGGHLTALRRAGAAGLEAALMALDAEPGPGEILVAATLSLGHRPEDDLCVHLPGRLLVPAAAPAIGAALALLDPPRIGPRLRAWLDGDDPLSVLAALEACSRLRADPGPRLAALLRHGAATVAAQAVRLAGELGRADLGAPILDRLGSCPEAARAAVLLGERHHAPPHLLPRDPGARPKRWREAAELLPLAVPPAAARAEIARLLGHPATRRWAVVAAGALGLPETLDWLIAQMEDPLLARSAGLAFGQITGARLGPDNLERATFPEDPEDPVADACRLERSIESHAYWPDPEKCGAWLAKRRAGLGAGERHLLGVAAWTHAAPPEPGHRTQLQLRALSLEIACRTPSAPLPDWRAPVRLGPDGPGRG